MSRSVWTESFRIRTSDADMYGLARLDALFGCFQEAAGHHARNLGVGRESLENRGCFWVLSRCWMRIHRYPSWGREIVVRTWPRGVHRLFAVRHFRILSQDEREFAAGISAWVILDAKKHRPVRPGPFLEHIVLPDEPEVEGDIHEKQSSTPATQELRQVAASYSDLDVNRHVNNAAYVRWILDSFSPEQHAHRQIGSIRIDYLSETLLGETISIQNQAGPSNNSQTITGQRKATDQPVFQAGIAWVERSTACG